MSNAKTVGAIYEAFGKGDVPGILGKLAENVEWEHDTKDHGIPWIMPGRGIAHAGKFFETVQRELDITNFVVTSIVGDGEIVVGLIAVTATAKSTGKSVTDHEAHQWTFGPDGKITRFRHIIDTLAHREMVQR